MCIFHEGKAKKTRTLHKPVGMRTPHPRTAVLLWGTKPCLQA